MSLKTRDVVDKLVGKFFFSISNSDHKVYKLYINQKFIVRTMISHGGKEIDDAILSQMAKQVGVQRLSFFKEMIKCTKSNDDFLNEIMKNGYL